MCNVSVIVPTYNAQSTLENLLKMLAEQDCESFEIIIIDSSSTDDTHIISRRYTNNIIVIPQQEFDHGGTRAKAVSIAKGEILIFFTQDAIPSDENTIQNILEAFSEPSISCVCGRQLPHHDANPIAIHARQFNYPNLSQVKSDQNIEKLGIRVAFMSNSFAAYRRETYEKLGGFPSNTILAEDMYLAAKMVLAGYKVAYCAEATVYHSHNYTPLDEFRRYFDTGVFHACEPWIQEQLGGTSGEGAKFVISELKYLANCAPLWIPRALFTTGCKLLGYKLGKNYKKLPKSWCIKCSMFKSYWSQQ